MRDSDRGMIRAIRGPVTLITIGGLFALNNFTEYHFDQTWPVILIVFGLMSLLGRSMDRVPPPPQPPPGPPYGQGWYQPPPTASGPAQGSYSGSSYAQPSGTAKGGFGTSAPPRSDSGDASGGNV